jgi:hypothetical protein
MASKPKTKEPQEIELDAVNLAEEISGEIFISETSADGEPATIPLEDDERFCVYLGPTIKGLIQTGTIYPRPRRETVELLSNTISKFPRIKRLIVSDKTLVLDRVRVQTTGNALNHNYRLLEAEITNQTRR